MYNIDTLQYKEKILTEQAANRCAKLKLRRHSAFAARNATRRSNFSCVTKSWDGNNRAWKSPAPFRKDILSRQQSEISRARAVGAAFLLLVYRTSDFTSANGICLYVRITSILIIYLSLFTHIIDWNTCSMHLWFCYFRRRSNKCLKCNKFAV